MLTLDRLSLDFVRYSGLARQTHTRCLDGISMAIDRGELVAVIGASGGGKSLLAHAIMGVLPPNSIVSGNVRVDGVAIDPAGRRALCGSRFALVPQSISWLDPLARSGKQIGWAARRAGYRRDQIDPMIPAIMAQYGLPAATASAFPHQLSGGMARRVLLAIAMAGDADFLIADEPTSGLDADNAGIALRQLRGLADDDKAVMLITHDLVAALPFADKVAIVRHGQLAALERAADFRGNAENLQSDYARALWQALPQNGFTTRAIVDA